MANFDSFDGTTLYYETEGDGQPVVLLHGFTSSVEGNWKRPGIWQAIVDSGCSVIGLDARGHGKSSKPHDGAAYENDAMVRDVDALLTHLSLSKVDVVGYSMGAMTALRFAVGESRVRRLVLGGIGGDPAEWGSEKVREARAVRSKAMLEAAEAADPSELTDPLARRVRKLMEARGNDLQAMSAVLRSWRPFGADLDPQKVTARTLVVCGDQDVPAAPLAAAIPGAQAITLNGDHEGVVSDPELAKVIVAFLTELDED